MSSKIVVSSHLNQVLVAIIEDERLAEVYLESEHHHRTVGNIYNGRVENVLRGMDASFVDIGLERNAFLYVGDVKPGRTRKTITQLVHKGDKLPVQVVKEPEGTKGARVIGKITIPGRYLVLLPMENQLGISRKITNSQERARLQTIADAVRPEGMGLIVRTVASGASEKELRRDCRYLLQLWEEVKERMEKQEAPSLVYQDHDLVYRIVRDLLTESTEEVLVDDKRIYNRMTNLVKRMRISPAVPIHLYKGRTALFTQVGIEKDLERATNSRVWLDSGGYLIIDPTEALTCIDVNTGKYVGKKSLKQTVVKTNLEAAEEIARQLRLRNIGGIVIIDFIDMEEDKEREMVVETLKRALSLDKTKSHVLGFTQLGLVEMTRKKSKTVLANMLETDCPHCSGTGRVPLDDAVAFTAAQKLAAMAREQDVKRIVVRCHPAVGELLKPIKQRIRKPLEVTNEASLDRDYVEIVPQAAIDNPDRK